MGIRDTGHLITQAQMYDAMHGVRSVYLESISSVSRAYLERTWPSSWRTKSPEKLQPTWLGSGWVRVGFGLLDEGWVGVGGRREVGEAGEVAAHHVQRRQRARQLGMPQPTYVYIYIYVCEAWWLRPRPACRLSGGCSPLSAPENGSGLRLPRASARLSRSAARAAPMR